MRTVPNNGVERNLIEYFDMLIKLRKMHQQKEFKYLCMEQFVKENGQFFDYAPLPKEIKFGPIKQCFHNAFRLAKSKGFIYVEGYVQTSKLPIPIHHAWVADKLNNMVIDNTLHTEDNTERAYFGVKFPTSYMAKFIGKCSCLDNWKGRFPLLTGKHTYNKKTGEVHES